MTIKIMQEVWEHSRHSGSHLLCLLAIADRANDDGAAWPGVAELSKKTRVSERQVYNILDKLLESVEIIAFNRCKKEGGFTSNLYIVVAGCNEQETNKRIARAHDEIKGIVHWSTSTKSERPEAHFTTPTEAHFTTPLKPTSEESSVEPSVEPSLSANGKKPKAARKEDPIFDIVALKFFGIKDSGKVNGIGGRIAKAKQALMNVEQELTVESIVKFCEWYKEKYPRADLPRDGEKIKVHWSAYKQAANTPGDDMTEPEWANDGEEVALW